MRVATLALTAGPLVPMGAVPITSSFAGLTDCPFGPTGASLVQAADTAMAAITTTAFAMQCQTVLFIVDLRVSGARAADVSHVVTRIRDHAIICVEVLKKRPSRHAAAFRGIPSPVFDLAT